MKSKLMIMGAILLFVLLLGGCKNPEEKARAKYNQAILAADKQELDKCEELLEEIVDDYGETQVATMAINELKSLKAVKAKIEKNDDRTDRFLRKTVQFIHSAAISPDAEGFKYAVNSQKLIEAGVAQNDKDLSLYMIFKKVAGGEFDAYAGHNKGNMFFTYDSETGKYGKILDEDQAKDIFQNIVNTHGVLERVREPMRIEFITPYAAARATGS